MEGALLTESDGAPASTRRAHPAERAQAAPTWRRPCRPRWPPCAVRWAQFSRLGHPFPWEPSSRFLPRRPGGEPSPNEVSAEEQWRRGSGGKRDDGGEGGRTGGGGAKKLQRRPLVGGRERWGWSRVSFECH